MAKKSKNLGLRKRYDRLFLFSHRAMQSCEGLNTLTEQEKTVFEEYYLGEKDFAEVGEKIGLSGARAAQICNNAEKKIIQTLRSFESTVNENIKLKTQLFEQKAQNGSVPIKKELLQPVSVLDVDVRTKGLFRNLEIKSILDLVRYSEEDLLKFRNFGKNSLFHLKIALKEKNFSLGMQVYEME